MICAETDSSAYSAPSIWASNNWVGSERAAGRCDVLLQAHISSKFSILFKQEYYLSALEDSSQEVHVQFTSCMLELCPSGVKNKRMIKPSVSVYLHVPHFEYKH